METVVWKNKVGAIIKYPKHFDVDLVEKRHGITGSVEAIDVREDMNCDGKKRKRKKRKRPLNKGEEEQATHYLKIRDFLLSSFESLMKAGDSIGYFPVRNEIKAPPTIANTVDWIGLSELDKIVPPLTVAGPPPILELTQDDFDKDIDVFGKIICNRASRDIRVTVCGSRVIIPSSSSFLLSDICKVQLLKNFSTYNVIVVDPPWENRSAIRGGKYKWLHKEDISSLPVPGLLASGGLLAIWVTNKRQLVQWVIQELLPLWGVVYSGEWIWIKVTTKGDFVFDIDSVHKKPYESLIIGKKPLLVDGPLTDSDEFPPSKAPRLVESHCVATSRTLISESPEGEISDVSGAESSGVSRDQISTSDDSKINTASSLSLLPSRYSLLCVPSTIHSQKPYLGDILRPHVEGGELRGLEIFARNLLPGWTSWGNEVLRFQSGGK